MKIKNIKNKNLAARLLIYLSWQIYNYFGLIIPPYKWHRNSLNDYYSEKIKIDINN